MVSDADLREAEAVESGFGAFDLRKIGGGDRAAVLDARREAGTGRLFCEGKASFAGEGTDFGLGELRGDQGSEGVMHRSGLLAGAEVTAVVEVHAVGNVRETSLLATGFHAGEELVFAVETALGVVALVVGVVEFGGEKGFGGDAVLGGEGEGGGELGAGEGRGVCDDREHARAQREVRGVREESRIRAAGVGDEERVERAERLVQQGGFFRQLHWMILAFAHWMLCLATDAFSEMRGWWGMFGYELNFADDPKLAETRR